MEEHGFGAFSWLWGGFGVGDLCLLAQRMGHLCDLEEAAMSRSCLSCRKKKCYFNIEDLFCLDFFFQT